MASTRLKTTKAGKRFYEIRVRTGRNTPELTKRWYVPDGWGQKAINRELNRVAVEFESQCQAGGILTREQKKEKAAQDAAQAARILTVKQYGERVFMPAKSVTFGDTSRENYQIYLNTRIYPAIGGMKLPEVSSANINALLLSIQSEGKSHATVVKVYNILLGLFKMAYMSDMIHRNPMDRVERPKPRKGEEKSTEGKAYTVEELRYIMDCLENEPLKWRVFVRILIDTGMRRGECCALRWENIDFTNKQVTIDKNLCYTKERGTYLDTPKNGRSRTISIGNDVISLLRELRAEQAEKAISPYVFTQEGNYKPMYPQSPTRYLKKFSQRYGLPGLHPHKLRHSFASVAITMGADVASVSEVLGHTDKATTLRMYTHASQESIERAGNIFRNALQAGKNIK